MSKNEMFASRIAFYCRRKNVSTQTVRFVYNGYSIHITDTPNSLHMDNYAVVEIKPIKVQREESNDTVKLSSSDEEL